MTTERVAELREKYKSVQLGSWSAVEKLVSGAYQDIKELLEELERVKAERDAYKGTAKSMGQTNKALAQKLVEVAKEEKK